MRAAPLIGRWDPVLTWWTLVPAGVGIAIVVWGPRLATVLRWRRLLVVAALGATLWSVALALVDGPSALTGPVESRFEYLPFARTIADVGEFVRTFDDGRLGSVPVHVKGHPPGLPAFLAIADRLGLAESAHVAALYIAGGAAAVVAVLVLAASVAGEAAARRAAPFVVTMPAAVWIATSADALFAGVALTGVALVARGARRRHDVDAAVGGVLLGVAVHLSYGLVLAGVLAVAVAWRHRSARAVALGIAGAVAVTALFLVAGFAWWDGLARTHEAYLRGVASHRPYTYALVGNLAALAIALGPSVAVALGRLRGRMWWLVGAACAAVAIADVSGLSKGEVERIWLFLALPIGAASTALARRPWLALHVGAGLVLATALRSPW